MPGLMKKKREEREIDERIAAKKKEVKKLLESEIEDKVCRYAKTKGIDHRKLSSPSRRSVPDRVLYPGQGRSFYIEFKQLGKKPTKSQWREIRRLEDLGFCVYVIDNIEQGKRIIDLWSI